MLLGNAIRLASSPAYYLGGVYVARRDLFLVSGSRKRFAYGEGAVASVTNRAAVPEGYLPPYCWDMPQKSGGLSSRRRILGTGVLAAANLAGGLNAVSSLTGSGTITNAALGLILSAVASLSGSGTLTAAVVGKLEAAAALSGSGSMTAALGAIADLVGELVGSGAITASMIAKAGISADITVTGELLNTANVGEAVWAKVIESGYSATEILRLLAGVAAGKTTIIDTGGGTATVTFRDLADTKDRLEAEMDGSERVNVTEDLT